MKFNFVFSALMMALLTLTIFSCKDDADEATLVGTWKVKTLTEANCTDPDNDFTTTADANYEFCETLGTASFCSTLTIAFTDAAYTTTGVTTTTIGGLDPETETDVTSGTYTKEGTQIIMCETGGDCETFTFTLAGNTVNLTGNDGDCDVTIIGEK